MNSYDRFYDEACAEARDVIDDWMGIKLREELQIEHDGGGDNWHEDTDAFLQRFLSQPQYGTSKKSAREPTVDMYNEDASVAVDYVMNNMHKKLKSSTLAEYESKEKTNKPVVAKDPRITMEMRQQKVREAKEHREEKAKRRLKENMQKKQNVAVAREIVKQEALEKVHKQRLEEEAIQQEMAKIRRQMQDLKKQHEMEMKEMSQLKGNAVPVVSKNINTNLPSTSGIAGDFNRRSYMEAQGDGYSARKFIGRELQANIQRFELFQKQKLMRTYFHHWIKIVLSKRAAMGKAKALADWHLLLKTWSAWRKYYFEHVAERDTQLHEKNIKQMKIHNHVASNQHRLHLLTKCFHAWRKFVKKEQFSKELLKEQIETRKKMETLLSAVTSQAKLQKNNLILENVEEDVSSNECQQIHPVKDTEKQSNNKISTSNQNRPKHAWQVRRSDVHKLTLQQIENMAGDSSFTKDATKVQSFKPHSTSSDRPRDRIQASKQLIAQQREMITKQRQVIEEQKRKLNERTLSLEDATDTVTDVSDVSHTSERPTGVHHFQPPKQPKSLLAMEKRAEERLKRREEMQERKRQAEQERIDKRRLEEEERIKQEEEEKRKKIEELKRMKQLEIEKENQRKAFIARMQELRHKAEQHYQRTILQKFGLKPLKNLKENMDRKMKKSQCHYEQVLSRKVFLEWKTTLAQEKQQKQLQADRHYRGLLISRYFNNWLKYGEAMSILERKAEIHHNHTLKVNYLRKWERFVIDEKLAYFRKEEIALNHNTTRLKKRVIKTLVIYKQSLKREEIRSQRIAYMRRKVAQLLPDFNPSSSQDVV